MDFLLKLFLILGLVFLNGYFVASEFSLVAARKTRIASLAKRGNKVAKQVLRALKDLDSFISATQLGITLASLGLGWIGEPVLASFIEPYFSFLGEGVANISSHTVSFAIAFFIITFLHIVLGEVAPKSLALQRAESVSFAIIGPLNLFNQIFRPFIIVLNLSGSLVLKLFGLKAPSGHQLVHSEEEIRMLLTQSAEEGVIEEEEVEMLERVFTLGESPVKHFMVPRSQIMAFDVKQTLGEVEKKIRSKPHSRFPIYEDSIDNILGFIHVKEIYQAILKKDKDTKISEANILRKIISIPESRIADDCLKDMKKARAHIAVVTDEFAQTAGIVTLQDIIESLVGKVEDEFEKPIKEFEKLDNGMYLVDGFLPIEKFEGKFKLPIKGQGYRTIGGLIVGLLGREAKKGDKVQIGDYTLEIEQTEKKRIRTIKVIKAI